jgi:hypothetical protein
MSYLDAVNDLAEDAEQLEHVYQSARKAGEAEAFKAAIDASYATAPENLLYAAWFYRLKHAAAQASGYVIAWSWAIPLALINALLFWWLSNDRFMITVEGFQGDARDYMPVIVLLASSLAAAFVLIYLTVAGHKRWRLGAIIGILLLATAAYVLLTYPQTDLVLFQEQYLTLMAIHLPLLAWAGVGTFLIFDHRDPLNRFAFLIKSLEIVIVAGLFIIAGGLFTAITFGLFDALSVSLPDLILRLFLAGGLGMVIIVAVAVIYNPTASPAEQSFDEGLSKLVALLVRLLLPLTLLVGLIYLIFIVFNFRAPFENRDVLIVYNAMLFAIVALLVGATPVNLADISPRLARWLRLGIIAVAGLALLVSLYALAAILYRTSIDRLTPNRLTFIGWNIVNIGLLILLLFFQLRANKSGQWLHGLYKAFAMGTVAYVVWIVVVILSVPWLFGVDQAAVENLPLPVQKIIYEHPAPILLKCTDSPHIYLLEEGEKRWIDTIQTFNGRGYAWRDVEFITCQELRSIPSGVPIPADAGPPPEP